jgi:HK97 family phage major capsid protein
MADDVITLSFASELPYERWWGVEVLECTQDAVDLRRLNDGGALLVGHRDTMHVGSVVPGSAVVRGDRKLACDGRFASDDESQKYRQRVDDDILQKVSVGYMIHELVEENVNETGARVARTISNTRALGVMQRAVEAESGDREAFYRELDEAAGALVRSSPSTFRVTKWEPFEVSLVAIPADPTVGVGRALEGLKATREFSTHAGRAGQQTKEQHMDEVKEKPAATAPDIKVIEDRVRTDMLAVQADIRALGEKTGQRDVAEKAIAEGLTMDQFRQSVLEKIVGGASKLRPAESEDIGMSRKDLERFSFCRLILAAMDPFSAELQRAAAFERECSEAARQKMQGRAKEREGGITIPTDVLKAPASAFGNAYARALVQAQRDLVVGTPTAGGNLVATDLLSSSFIDMLRARSRVVEMGATVLSDLSGNIALPRQTGGATTYWVAENGAPTESQQVIDQVAMSPKTIAAWTDYSRRLLIQSSIDVEVFVRGNLASDLGTGADLAAVNGAGASNEPTGVLNTAGIGSVAGGANGAAPTWDNIVELETLVGNANADFGRLAYLTNSKVRGKLKRTQKFASTNGQEIWMTGRDSRNGIGEANGYDAYVSNNIPSNLVKGASGAVCSAIIFGDWTAVMIGLWGGLDIMLDPYSQSTTGAKRVVAMQDMDVALRRAASMSAMKDVLTV